MNELGLFNLIFDNKELLALLYIVKTQWEIKSELKLIKNDVEHEVESLKHRVTKLEEKNGL